MLCLRVTLGGLHIAEEAVDCCLSKSNVVVKNVLVVHFLVVQRKPVIVEFLAYIEPI